MRANALVRFDDLIDEIWGESAPQTAPKMVQNAVSKLRKSGFAEVLTTRAGGYVLQVDPDAVDARRFERLLEQSRAALAANRPEVAEQLLAEAQTLWRGAPLADLSTTRFARLEIDRLEELRLEATEATIEAGFALGRHRELSATLETLVAQHPVRETLRLQLMTSLYHSGRQAEALAVYQAARAFLRDELGLEPSPALQRLEQAILLQDPALDPEFLTPPDVAPVAQRKTLTVLNVGVVRQGRALDPEALLALTAKAEESLRTAIEAHGGVVASTTGEAVIAIFGLATIAEDDTLRAARSALAARAAIDKLNVSLERDWGARCQLRIGIATGTALVDPAHEQAGGATGEVFAQAARLAHVAGDTEILLAPSTHRTARNAVVAEPAPGVELDAESETVWRLLDVLEGAIVTRHLDLPLVGREWELAQLQHAYERAATGQTSYLATVLGPAGIGKSRLARAFAETVEGAPLVLTGHCPSYGAGITFRPLAEVVRGAAGATTHSAIASLLTDNPESDEIAARIAGALGEEDPGGTA
ncbi:MAG: hypothetical protein QOD52_1917, partial [Gaiellaceae bacterium]|nr:hypothetical protein [Gaiellaceae bacterium]